MKLDVADERAAADVGCVEEGVERAFRHRSLQAMWEGSLTPMVVDNLHGSAEAALKSLRRGYRGSTYATPLSAADEHSDKCQIGHGWLWH